MFKPMNNCIDKLEFVKNLYGYIFFFFFYLRSLRKYFSNTRKRNVRRSKTLYYFYLVYKHEIKQRRRV